MKRIIVLALLASQLMFCNAFAEDNSVAAQEWRAYMEPLAPIGERLVAQMPDSQDPQLRQELYRQVFSGMSAAYLGLFQADTEYPDLWPINNEAYDFFGPNPDDAYTASPIDPKGIYRISGFRGTVRIVDFCIGSGHLVTNGTDTVGPVLANYDLDRVAHINKKDGSFDVVLSAERPAGYKGDWLKLDAKATYLFVRQISYDWLHEVDGRFAIERLDLPAIKPRPGAQKIEMNLRQIPVFAENWTKWLFPWAENLRSKGLINKVEVRDLSNIGGITTQKYIQGLFELGPDEALIYETEVPKQCQFWNIQLTDMLMATIDYMNRQTSLNGYTAKLDKDGKFRAVVSATDPGVPNWLDTAGYAKGVIFGRWKECSSEPTPTLIKVKLAEVRKYLPADTPVVSAETRDAALRLRRKGAQLRRRW